MSILKRNFIQYGAYKLLREGLINLEMFGFINMLFPLFFIIILGFIIFTAIKGIGEWGKNNNSPKLSVPAQVVSKRSRTSGGAGDSSASTSYFVTFEFESGDRMELRVSGREYGMLADDDLGLLSFQGTRYLSFERK